MSSIRVIDPRGVLSLCRPLADGKEFLPSASRRQRNWPLGCPRKPATHPLCRPTAKIRLMANPIFAVRCLFAVRFLVADGKAFLCRPLADGKESADGKSADSSSDGGILDGQGRLS